MHRRMMQLFPVISGGVAALPYEQVLVQTYGASEVWALTDISAGTTITAQVAAARNGALVGWDLQNAAGPVTGTLAPYSDGANDYGNIDTASHVSIFNGGIGSAFIWGTITNWADATLRRLLYLFADGTNRIILYRETAATFKWFYQAGGTSKTGTLGSLSGAGWFSFGISWKDVANGDSVIFYKDGAQVGIAQTSNGTFSGSLGEAWIGAGSATPTTVWDGLMAYCAVKYGAIWTPAQFAAIHAAAST